ncbi:unnamed protein product [Paramecium primaurelia]|uniref:Uncharacterized protein n=1 Tax=Paramecium primaurelia TaxID=5886 RepID=A0A8S1LY02_PARPR|nr:unnamed protein product [Paramecium primaurelia]
MHSNLFKLDFYNYVKYFLRGSRIFEDFQIRCKSIDTLFRVSLLWLATLRKVFAKLTSSIITSDYLLGVLFDKIQVPNLNEGQIGVVCCQSQ